MTRRALPVPPLTNAGQQGPPLSRDARYADNASSHRLQLYTLGFPFRPWKSGASIADGPSILQYIRDTAEEFGIDKKVHLNSKVTAADWDSATCRWTLTVTGGKDGEQQRKLVTKFISFTTGYYDYDTPLQTKIPGLDNFKGQVIHPQFWPKDLDYTGKKVVVIGSGATAVTLLPNMADKVEHITMVQRSPAYYLALKRNSPFTAFFRAVLPEQMCHTFLRTLFAFQAYLFYYACQWFPNALRRLLRFGVARHLPRDFPLDPHFNPSYMPWDQRLCFVPDGDLFKCLHSGKASIVTGHIDTFTKDALVTKAGEKIQADIVVTATGLKIKLLGGAGLTVDGQPIKLGQKMVYKGTFLQGVPNAGLLMGYVNASWTLGSDISALHVTKLLNHLDRKGLDAATPQVNDGEHVDARPLIALKSNYLARAEDEMPKAGSSRPWWNKGLWMRDHFTLWSESFNNSVKFSKATKPSPVVES